MPTYRPPIVRRNDWLNPIALLVLAVIAVLFIKSAQSYTHGTQWHQQIVWLSVGAALYIVVGALDYHLWLKNAHWIYFASLFLLLLVVTPLGQTHGSGARRWLGLGPFSIQPSEFAKIGTLIMVASVLARSELGTIRDSLGMLGKVGLVILAPIV